MNFRRWLGRRFGLTDSEPWAYFAGTSSSAGKVVTERAALQLATAWACVRLNSEAVASLPLQMFSKGADGSRDAVDHPLAEILAVSPNADMTGHEFWSAMVAWLLVRGNAFAEIVRDGDRIVALNLLPADQVTVTRDAEYNLHYRFTDRGKPYDLPPEQVLHVKGFGFGGDLGLSPIVFGANVLGTAIAADEAAGSVFAHGMSSGGFITADVDEEITKEKREQFQKLLDDYSGSANAGKLMLLPGNLKFNQVSFDAESTQLLESRRYNVEDICRLFGTPPIVVGHAAEGQTMWGSGVEAIVLHWLTIGLNPLLDRIEKRIRKQLLRPGERGRVYVEFNREGLLQADSAAKAAFLSTVVQNGLMTRNEARTKLNLPTVAGGDALTVQMNLAPIDKLGADATGSAAAKSALKSWLGLEDEKND